METKVIDIAAGTSYSFDIQPYSVPKAGKMRFVFVSDKGQSLDVYEPTRELDPDDNWVRISVPLAKFKLLGDISEFRLKRLLVFTDTPSIMHLGEIKLVTDTTPIKVEPLGTQTVAIKDLVLFLAQADGGVSNLEYNWDFNSSDGIQVESTDKVARYVYTRGGDYVVTLTVKDADGIKEPVSVTGVVIVTD